MKGKDRVSRKNKNQKNLWFLPYLLVSFRPRGLLNICVALSPFLLAACSTVEIHPTVQVCHEPNEDPVSSIMIAVDRTAVLDHLSHGDRIVTDYEDSLAGHREGCEFTIGARVEETLGVTPAEVASIPLSHVVVVMQENRSFDHYFATLHQTHADVEPLPPDYANPDPFGGRSRIPFRLESSCLPTDLPHDWCSMHQGWNEGLMNGFLGVGVAGIPAGVCRDGRERPGKGDPGYNALGYYDEGALPFYHWLARTFGIADRYFSSVLGPTWSNRAVLLTGSTYGIQETGGTQNTDKIRRAHSIFDALDEAGVSWGVFVDGPTRMDFMGISADHVRVEPINLFLRHLVEGTLPRVSFVDPGIFRWEDEHPGAGRPIQNGEDWMRTIYNSAVSSPLWSNLAIFFTYDESGGFFDHVPPPKACPMPEEPGETHLGIRVPMMLISPWARPGYVSHQRHEHASILRFIELLYDLPALSTRDANADAFLDMFNFTCEPPLLHPPPNPPAAGTLECR